MKLEPRRGQAMVEFAAALPLFLVLMGAVVDAGRGVLAQASLAGAVRDGARAGAVAYPSSGWDRMAVERTSQNVLGVDATSLTIDVAAEISANGTYVTVQAAHPFKPFFLFFLPEPIRLSAVGRALVGQMP